MITSPRDALTVKANTVYASAAKPKETIVST